MQSTDELEGQVRPEDIYVCLRSVRDGQEEERCQRDLLNAWIRAPFTVPYMTHKRLSILTIPRALAQNLKEVRTIYPSQSITNDFHSV